MSGGFKVKKRQDDWATTTGRGASSLATSHLSVYVSDSLQRLDNLTKRFEKEYEKSLLQRHSQLLLKWSQLRLTDDPRSTWKMVSLFVGDGIAVLGALIRSVYEYDGEKLVSQPPGFTLLALADFLYSKKTVEQIAAPLIADMQFEYNEALFEGRKYKAMWVRVRGGWSFFKTLGMYSVLRTFVEIWRKVISA